MVRNDARFHLVMLISSHSHRQANAFEALFTHADKQRSSDRAEMQEINDFWARELRSFTRVGADVASNLETDRGVDFWLKEIEDKLMRYILKNWRP